MGISCGNTFFQLTLYGKDLCKNALSNEYELRDQNITKTLPHWKHVCKGVPRDQPQPGSLSSMTREAEKRDPGNEVVMRASSKSSRKSFIMIRKFNEGKVTRHEWI